ncbi:MAG: isoprenoid biosynthesis glyoxalase ElbB [Bacteroidales bacterium]|nr:isoprenoid biosynthesis glyoxalase ElbB [Bacteroidales bacterium]MCF8389273.1 isoprenoid biosynthesis glyoxalase ElbB [Bacteroidales bacterium]
MAKTKKIAVVLSGCGVYDGAEIHEATLSLYAISKLGCEYEIFAPDINQHHVINHLTGEEMNETRNVLIESARIARGKIKSLSEFDAVEFDGLLFPGGFGAAKNLSDWAFKGPDGDVIPEVKKAISSAHGKKIPIGALCISPVLIAKVLKGVNLTIGSDQSTAEGIKKAGAKHTYTSHGEVVADPDYKVVTTPCYMLDATIAQIGEGAENVVKTMMEMMG